MATDPLEVVDVQRRPTDCLQNLLAGRKAFLVSGGPSAKPILSQLNRRGVFAFAVNNAAGNIVRAQAFVCSDPPLKFSHSIWMDPAIMKFVPTTKMVSSRSALREKKDGIFSLSDKRVTDCPNVWGFRRESWMVPDDSFFTATGACWGNLNAGVEKTGQSKTVCTMLLAMRLLHYLGASRVYMVGVDFHMTPSAGYSFGQNRTVDACQSNNAQFKIVNDWLCKMQQDGVFARNGTQFYNCNPNSGLRAFPYVPFDFALQDVVDTVEEEPSLSSWYEKAKCSKCKSWHIKPGSVNTCLDCGETWEEKGDKG